MSLYMGGGSFWVNFSHDSSGARRAKLQGVSMVARTLLVIAGVETRHGPAAPNAGLS